MGRWRVREIASLSGGPAVVLLLLTYVVGICSGQRYNISVIAGTGSISGDAGDSIDGTSAVLNQPYAVAVDRSNSNIYISEYNRNKIRRLSLSTGLITTFAGTGSSGSSGDGGAATSARLKTPTGLVFDSSNEYLYISDFPNQVIRRVQMTTNIITKYAGTYGSPGSSGDGGFATNAKFNSVHHIAMDSSNNMYLADSFNHQIRKIEYSSSIVSLFAGVGSSGCSGDGKAATSTFLNYPKGVAVDRTDTYVYIADTRNYRVLRVSLATNNVTTIAGNNFNGNLNGFSGDGDPAINALISCPEGLSFDGSGNLFFVDGSSETSALYSSNNRIRRIDYNSTVITTVAGSGVTSSKNEMNVYATAAYLNAPRSLAVDSNDNMYITEWLGYRVRKVTVNLTPSSQPTGQPTNQPSSQPSRQPTGQPSSQPSRQPTGQPSSQPSRQPTGQPSSQPSRQPTGQPSSQPSRQPTGQPSSGPSMRPSPRFNVSVVAGGGVENGDNIQGTSAELGSPYAVAVDDSDNYLYISDTNSHRVRRLSLSTGIITTFAGNGTKGSCGDGGDATSANFNSPMGLLLDSSSEYLYVSDYYNYVIRRVNMSSNIISLYAGMAMGVSGDEVAATSARFYDVRHLAMDSNNNMYVADYQHNKVMKITYSSSIVSTLAGSGTYGYAGDGSLAANCSLKGPTGVAVDRSNTFVYISDYGNHLVRRVSLLTNIIETVAGTGTTGFSGDGGAATSATLHFPEGMAFDSSGNLFVADFANNRIRKVAVSSNNQITTFAGSGITSYNGNNVDATVANLYSPKGVTIDSNDAVYVAESTGRRVRRVAVITPTMPPSKAPTSRPSGRPTGQPVPGPTSQPSSEPTSGPSPRPKKVATNELNPFETLITPQEAAFKIEYFIFYYIVYFVAIIAALYAVDKAGVLKTSTRLLEQSSFVSRIYRLNGYSRHSETGVVLIKKIIDLDNRLFELCGGVIEGDSPMPAAATSAAPLTIAGPKGGKAQSALPYSASYYEFLLARRCYLGCSDVLFKNGVTIPLVRMKVPRGMAENFVYYLCNNHTFLSCVFSIKGSPFSRSNRRLAFTFQHVLGLSLIALTNIALTTAGLSNEAVATLNIVCFRPAHFFNLLVVIPLKSVGGILFKSFFTKTSSLSLVQDRHSHLLVLFFLLLSCLLLAVASIFTVSNSRFGILLKYTVQVFLISTLLDVLVALFQFITAFHFAVHLFFGRFCLLAMGSLLCELIVRKKYVLGRDYEDRSIVLFDGLIRIDRLRRITSKKQIDARGETEDDMLLFDPTNSQYEMRSVPGRLHCGLGTERDPLHAGSAEDARVSVLLLIEDVHVSAAADDAHDDRIVFELNPMLQSSSKLLSAALTGPSVGVERGVCDAEGSEPDETPVTATAEYSFEGGAEEEGVWEVGAGSCKQSVKLKINTSNRRVSFVNSVAFFEERGIGASDLPSNSIQNAVMQQSSRKLQLAKSVVTRK